MYKRIIILTCLALFSLSCSNDDSDELVDEPSVVGVWKLTGYDVGFLVDINDDNVKNSDIIKEIGCDVNEEIVFKTDGTLAANDTFHHAVNIYKSDLNGNYNIIIECVEGYTSFATPYIYENDTVEFHDVVSVISNNQFDRVFENAIEIYNEDFTEIIEFRDLTLTYTRL